MIRNKWIWGAFAAFVALAFVGGDFLSGSGRGRGRGKLGRVSENSVGLLDGKSVSSSEYQMMHEVIALEKRSSKDENDNYPQAREIWEKYAALKTAEKLGITVSDTELAHYIHSDKAFQTEGRFNRAQYDFILQQSRISPVLFERYLKDSIIFSRLKQILSTGAIVPASMVDDRAYGFTDVFTIVYATISNTVNEAEITITDEDIAAYYEKNAESYRTPDMRSVKYVTFKASNFSGDSQSVTEDEIQSYYDDNIDQYIVKGENNEETTTPLESVSDAIKTFLLAKAAEDAAYVAAEKFADVFLYNSNKDFSFEAIAAEHGYSVVTSAMFSATMHPRALSVQPIFIESAFNLDMDSRDRRNWLSGAIFGNTESYVMMGNEKEDSYIPDLEKIKASVRNSTKKEAILNAFLEKIRIIETDIIERKNHDKSFVDVVTQHGMILSTNISLSVLDAWGSVDIPNVQRITRYMARMNVGEVSRIIPTDDQYSAAIVFAVEDRRPGDGMAFNSIQNQVKNSMFSEYVEREWNLWLKYNLESLNPEPVVPFE